MSRFAPPPISHTPASAHRRRRAAASLVEVLVVVAIFALGLIAAATRLQSSVQTGSGALGDHVIAMTSVPGAAPVAPVLPSEPLPPPPPKPEKRDGGGWGDFWDGAKAVGGFVLDNFTPVGDIKTLLDPNASTFDKILSGVSLVSSVVPGLGQGVKAATTGIKLANRAVDAARAADKAVDAGDDVRDATKVARDADELPGIAGGRRKPDEPECEGDACRRGPGENCFAAGTTVFTEHGDRPIESITVGDRVWSRDPSTGVLALQVVVQTFAHDAYVIDLEIGAAGQNEHLTVTDNHPFWVEGHGWTAAGMLDGSSRLWTPNGTATGHASSAWGAPTRVYNLEVASSHTYFVGSLHSWVHNQDADGCKKPGAESSDDEARRRAEEDEAWGQREGDQTEPDEVEVEGPRSSDHADQRGREGRNTSAARGDAQRARQADVFVQKDGRYVVRGSNGREHIFEPDGQHVTTVDQRTAQTHRGLVDGGTRRPISAAEYEIYRELFE